MSVTSAGDSSGRSRADRYSPLPLGDRKARPFRPLPPVCSSATATRPSGAPAMARRLHSVLVESMHSKHRRGWPRWQSVRGPLSSPSRRRSGADCRQYPRLGAEAITYPSCRRASTAFHTAARLMPSSRLMASPDRASPRFSVSSASTFSRLMASPPAPPTGGNFSPYYTARRRNRQPDPVPVDAPFIIVPKFPLNFSRILRKTA